ncbi:MAG: hypothetical protein KF703_08080 [Actinobacteria bacterium]|nr:hypothetical protein [Actinomycetota bacterium]
MVGGHAGPDDAGTLLAAADAQADEGAFREAVDSLVAANRATRRPAIEERLVALRHEAVASATAPSPGPRPDAPASDPFGAPGIPQIDAADLTAAVLGAALAHRGSLIVRGLLDLETAARLRDDIDRAFAARDAHEAGAPVTETSPWYVPFHAAEGYTFGDIERFVSRAGGGVLSVDSPRALFDVIEAFHAIGLGRLLEEHFGEWPVLSAKKSTLRRATPESPTEWHQDGAFLGRDTRTVNVWTALTACGVDAPGVDVFARPFDEIVETGGETARFHWSVPPDRADQLQRGDIERPTFGPGDALIFDQLTLHRTALSPTMTQDRYAIESWFFAPSTYPHEQVPILF